MIRIATLLLVLFGCLPTIAAGFAQTRTVTDMAGRKVAVPRRIKSVYCTNPACAILVYTLAPDRLAGWPLPLAKGASRFIADPYRRIPVVGASSNNTASVEEILKMRPDVLLTLTMASGVSSAEHLQKQTHIPMFVVDISLRNLPKVYEALGNLLGEQARAAELAQYCRKGLEEVDAKVRTIPFAQRRHVYYANGPSGLETSPRGSLFSEPIDIAGGINVAQVSVAQTNATATVSMEQLLGWNPEIVIAAPSFLLRDRIRQDLVWAHVRAVRNHAVYEMPRYPFAWDRPFSAARILEIKWLATLFYPHLFHYDMRQETRDFYAKFYHRKPSEAELNELLQYSLK
jgi:iron complex transport system substrate-binding protein